MSNSKRAAVLQSNFVCGGTSQVSLSAIRVLNELGITPDLFCFRGMTQKQVGDYFQDEVRFNLVKVSDGKIRGLGAVKGPFLNWYVGRFYGYHRYEIVFNSHGYLHFLPDKEHIVNYLLLPRKVEILSTRSSQKFLKRWLYSSLLLWAYRFERLNSSSRYLILSEYARDLLVKHYTIPDVLDLEVLYPPVNVNYFWCDREDRDENIVSVGSFDPTKNQMAQIRLAEALPNYHFDIIGDASLHPEYYMRCRRYVEENHLSNISLHSNLPWLTLRNKLQNSLFFLHTKVGEHFGIAAVEAMAAGCIPVVHNSGGQKETVPWKNFRFDSIDEVPRIVQGISRDEISSTRAQVQEFIRRFDEALFRQRLRTIMAEILGTS
jgi:glycosyltransferase involved in cell wall biosynthesis